MELIGSCNQLAQGQVSGRFQGCDQGFGSFHLQFSQLCPSSGFTSKQVGVPKKAEWERHSQAPPLQPTFQSKNKVLSSQSLTSPTFHSEPPKPSSVDKIMPHPAWVTTAQPRISHVGSIYFWTIYIPKKQKYISLKVF